MRLYFFKNKLTLKFKNNAADFIKRFSTNVVEAPRNAFVDLKGRVVAVFDQKRVSKDEMLVVIERQFLDRVKKHLEKYLALESISMEETALKSYWDLDKNGPLMLAEEPLESHVSEEEFTLFRLKNHWPLQGIDFDEELLLNVGNEEFVSYTKGCYFGQEVIARVHYRGKPPKQLVVAEETAENSAVLTSKTKDPATGKTIGFYMLQL